MARRQNTAALTILVVLLSVSQAHGRFWPWKRESHTVTAKTPYGTSVSTVSVGGHSSGSSFASASAGTSANGHVTGVSASSHRNGSGLFGKWRSRGTPSWRSSGTPTRTRGVSADWLVMDKRPRGYQFPSVPSTTRKTSKVSSHASVRRTSHGSSSVHTGASASASSHGRTTIKSHLITSYD